MSQLALELKNDTFLLPVIHLRHGDVNTLLQQLKDKILQAPRFFLHAPVVIDISSFNEELDWQHFVKSIDSQDLKIVGVVGCKNETLKQQILLSGVSLLAEGKEQKVAKNTSSALTEVPPHARTHIVTEHVRSGQKIYARNADLVVLNNVSAGAELLADGNIYVYGALRGRALAGANGDRQVHIFCTNLGAELLSIAGEYWLMDQIPEMFLKKACHLFLKDGTLSIRALEQV